MVVHLLQYQEKSEVSNSENPQHIKTIRGARENEASALAL